MTREINYYVSKLKNCLLAGAFFAASINAFAIPASMLEMDQNPSLSIQERKKDLQKPNLTSDEKALIHLELAAAYTSIGDAPAHELHMSKAQGFFASTSNTFIPCVAIGIEALHKADFGTTVESFNLAKRAIACSENVSDELERAYIRDTAAWAILGGDNEKYSVAQPLLEEAMNAYKKHNLKFRELYARFGLSRVYLSIRSSKEAYKEALAVFEEAKALGTAPSFEGYVAYQAGAIALREKDYNKGIELLEFSIKKAQALGEPGGVSTSKYMLARTYVALRRWDAAVKLLNEVLPQLKEEGYVREYSIGMAALERALAAKGRADADELWRHVDMTIMNTPERIVNVFTYRAEALNDLGRHKEAYEVQKELVEQLEKMYQRSTDKRLANMASEYQLDKKEIEINRLRLEKQVADANEQIAHAKQQYWISILVIIVFVSVFVAWRQNKFKKEALHLALTDMGTGAPNRRAIMQKLDSVYNNAIPCLVGIADLDYFKKINDTFGHDVGDRVLSSFYLSCKNVFNNGEFVGRFGGEEWFFILPRATAEEVKRLHKAITLELNHICSDVQMVEDITFSFGVTYLDLTKPITNSIKEADKNLYNAKHTGRNKVVI